MRKNYFAFGILALLGYFLLFGCGKLTLTPEKQPDVSLPDASLPQEASAEFVVIRKYKGSAMK